MDHVCAGKTNSREKLQHQQKQLDLFINDKGLWRSGGRLANADIPYSTKHPVLLPQGHPFTAMIVRDAQERVSHNGIKKTLTEVRAKFWIMKGRSLVRSIIHHCVDLKEPHTMLHPHHRYLSSESKKNHRLPLQMLTSPVRSSSVHLA